MRLGRFHRWWLIIILLNVCVPAWAEWEPAEIVGMAYPLIPRMARIEGFVIVRVSVGPDGSVRQAEAVSGHPLLEKAAEENARKWKFKLSERPGRARDPYLIYRFILTGTCAIRDCRTSFVVEFPKMIEFPNLIIVTGETHQLQYSRSEVSKNEVQ